MSTFIAQLLYWNVLYYTGVSVIVSIPSTVCGLTGMFTMYYTNNL